VIPEGGTRVEEIGKEVSERVNWALDHILDFCRDLAEGKRRIC
jgi:hypothetical protein